MTGTQPQPTRWLVVLAALGGGVAAAAQVGKASAAMPLLRAEFGVSLTAVSFYLAVFSLGAALLGLTVGLAAQRFGPLRAGIAGLAVMSVASLAGAVAPGWQFLLAARLAEAVGLPLVVASMPALIQSACSPARRIVGLGIWAAWLPLGVALAMFLSVFLGESLGWRALYVGTGLLPLGAIAALLASRPGLVAPAAMASAASLHAPPLRRLPAPLLNMAAIFSLFSAIYLTLTGFLPSVAEADLGLSLDNAAILGGSVSLLVMLGNLLATILLVRGVSSSLLLVLAFVGIGVSATVFLIDGLPVWLRVVAGVFFNLAAGVAPGVVWSFVPVLSHRLRVGASLVSGVFYQAAGMGQLVGPILGGLAIDAAGSWAACLAVILPCSLLAVLLSLRASRI